MKQLITSPERFASWFAIRVPGAYRQVTADDVELLTERKLIKRYGYYSHDDLQTVIGILNYEQLREKRTTRQEDAANHEPPRCKLCGEVLLAEPEGKVLRPKEYCGQCEPLRARERYRKWRKKEAGLHYREPASLSH